MNSRFHSTTTRKSLFLTTLIVCLFVALRLWNLTTYGLWFDEAFSHQAAQLGWSESIKYVSADVVHPPLFYFLLKLWIGIGGESLLWLKLFPVITAIATIMPFWLLCHELGLTAAETNTAFLLMAVNAFLIQYSQELRMYSLLLFFTLWSLWLFVRLIHARDRTRWILVGLFAINLLLVYTHYFGWLVVATEGLYLLFGKREHLLAFSAMVAVLIICFAPWAYVVINAAAENRGLEANLSWVKAPGISGLTWYFATLNGPFFVAHTSSVGLIIFALPLFCWTWNILKGEQSSMISTFWTLAAASFVPVILALVISYLVRPVWAERSLIISAVPYLILVAVAVHKLRPAWARTIVLVLITGWAALSGAHMLKRGNYRFDWLGLARHIVQAESGERVRIYVFEKHQALPLRSALNFLQDKRFEVVRIEDVRDIQGTHFWIAFRDTTWKGDRLPQTFVRDLGCRVGQEFSVSTHVAENASVGEATTVFPVSCQP